VSCVHALGADRRAACATAGRETIDSATAGCYVSGKMRRGDMAELTRFGVSIQTRLLEQFDQLIVQKGYVNRSEAIRDLIRGDLVEVTAEREEGEMVGTVTFVYNHHVRQLTDLLTEFQHQNYGAVIASLHVHLDPENCLEVLVVRGKSGEIRRIANKLIGTKGVKHGKLTLTTTGTDLT
jgi:CopG family transcriptional regulator, nickel-responsive regulator